VFVMYEGFWRFVFLSAEISRLTRPQIVRLRRGIGSWNVLQKEDDARKTMKDRPLLSAPEILTHLSSFGKLSICKHLLQD